MLRRSCPFQMASQNLQISIQTSADPARPWKNKNQYRFWSGNMTKQLFSKPDLSMSPSVTKRLFGILIAAMFTLGLTGEWAQAASRKPIPRSQASDNILLCKANGGFVVRTPSVVACCNEQSDGRHICVGCSPDGKRCANYSLRADNRSQIRRALSATSHASGGKVAPRKGKSQRGASSNSKLR